MALKGRNVNTNGNDGISLPNVINAKEKHQVATVDIPGAFLQSQLKTNPIIQLDQQMVTELCKIDSTCKNYVTHEKGIPILYGKAQENIYGMMDKAKNYYDMFTSYLVDKLEYKLTLMINALQTI